VGKRGLGRGLSALIATGESVGGLKFDEIPISAVRPNTNQPRKKFSEAAIKELASSIREVGILQPLVVRPVLNGFELIAGERRLRAARMAGLDRVPVLIRQAAEGESMELALVENLQREDLNPLETATAYQALMEGFGISKEQLALRVGKSRAAVTNTLRLVQLPESVKRLLMDGDISEGHARALLSLKEEGQMVEVAERVRDEKLSVRKTEDLVRGYLLGQSREAGEQTSDPEPEADGSEFDGASHTIRQAIRLPVKVKPLRKGGKLEIRFKNREELDALVELLTATSE
jgi:ParB family transcriptional regulator, chromosome partitioning protein